ncbi:MAG: glycosyl hydrolase [Dongiaceae bacterium]
MNQDGARLRRGALALVGLLALGLLAGPAVAAGTGVYKGGGSVGRSRIPNFEGWLGEKIPRALDFTTHDTWSSVLNSATYIGQSWAGSRWRLTVSIPMIPADGVSTLAKAASGTYNDNFRKIAAALIGRGYGNAVIRLGWEFNGNWYPWAASKCPTCFVQAWRQIVTAMRSVGGAAFKFDWCMNIGTNGIAAEKVWPGDAYVDIVGMDIYNQTWDPSTQSPTARWSWQLTQSHGLNWLASFASAHGKPVSFPEWATGIRVGYPGVGGGDDPYFIQKMHDWIAAHNVAYHNYWDYNAPDFKAQLSNNQFPKAAAKYKALFGP